MIEAELNKLRNRAAGTALALPAVASQSRIKRVMAYCRASTKKQDMSIGDQITVLGAYMEAQKDWKCIEIIADTEKGKRREKRTQYLRMKDAIRNRLVDIVLVHELSRLGRNFAESIRCLELAEQHGVEIHTTNGPCAYPAAVLMAMVADFQIGASKEQIKRAHKAITMDGRHVGTAPYGYRPVVVDGRKGHLEIFEEEAKYVRQIFRWYLDGKSPVAICRLLNAMGVPSPRGKKWTTSNITHKGYRGILLNVVYKGYVCYNMTEKIEDADLETVSHKIRPLEEWVLERGKHEPIISEVDFDRAGERFAARPRSERTERGPLALFAGRLKCPHCMELNDDGTTSHGTMTITGAGRDRQTRVRCSGVGIGRCTNRRSFIRSEIHKTALEVLRTQLTEPTVIKAYLAEHWQLGKEAVQSKTKELKRLDKDVARMKAERDNLVKAIRHGGDPDLLNVDIAAIQKEIEKARTKMDGFIAETTEFRIDLPSMQQYIERIDDVLRRIQQVPAVDIDKPLIEELNALVDRIVVYPNADDRGFEVEIVGKLANIVNGTNALRGKFEAPNNIVKLVTLTVPDAAAMLRITFPRAVSSGYQPFRKKVEMLLANDTVPQTVVQICERLVAAGVPAKYREVERALNVDDDVFVNIRRGGYMLKSSYDRLTTKWLDTTDAIIDAAEISVRALGAPARTDQIRKAFLEQGIDIFGDGDAILRKSLAKSERLKVMSLKPTVWGVKDGDGTVGC